ncbi:hypothetical protein AVEN_87734-1 [Araneus ventricosus]|uniref:Uncharacterized protein n=1 Tax=Araneus ventricosus TaxID=182803 RepID=A0A4Y2L052_ARAVE|nr:hypothetical protein AVEN_87734-1 [Araneus ventricosus]
MFTLPALLYLKLLPLFGQCLYHLIVPNKSRLPHAGGALPAGPLPAFYPFWVGRTSVGIFAPSSAESKLRPLLYPLEKRDPAYLSGGFSSTYSWFPLVGPWSVVYDSYQ